MQCTFPYSHVRDLWIRPRDAIVLEYRLRVVPLFRDLSDASLKSIATRLKRERYPQGSVIFREGDVGDAMYVVESGQLEVTTGVGEGEQPLAYLGPGREHRGGGGGRY